MDLQPKVSVSVMTYNHAKFIRQALDSILMQETNFPFQAVVHDDASTDGTRDIVESYAKSHPDRIKAILQEENQMGKGRRILSILRPHLIGEYIASLDGDDFWTNRKKLQTQADFLDGNPGCAIIQTRCAYVDDTTGEKLHSFPLPYRSKPRHRLADLASDNFVQTSAAMVRASAVPNPMPAGFEKLPFGDYAQFSLAAREGWIGLIDEEMVVYRVHSSNFWYNNSQEERTRKTATVRAFIVDNLSPKDRGPWLEAMGYIRPTLLQRAFRRISKSASRNPLLSWIANR